VQLKANQATLFDAVCRLAAQGIPADAAFSRAIGRCRQEDRTVDVFPAGEALATTEWQSFVKTIVRVTRQTLCRAAATGLWEERGEVAFYVSSATELPASAWAAAIRRHWGIENRNHYVRDVSCGGVAKGSSRDSGWNSNAGEDQSRIRGNPGVMPSTGIPPALQAEPSPVPPAPAASPSTSCARTASPTSHTRSGTAPLASNASLHIRQYDQR